MTTLLTATDTRSASNLQPNKNPISKRKRLPAIGLCLCFGLFGTHRFYVGKVGTGIFQMLTLGGLGFWVFYDLILLILGKFCDAEGAQVKEWA